MMNLHTPEPDLRREAIRRRLAGEIRKDICTDLGRSTSWFDKWWAAYQRDPRTDFADHSRAPHTSAHQTPDKVVHTIVTIRQTLEAAATSDTKYGLIGPRAIQGQLESLEITPPSVATIQRILQAHGLTHPLGAGKEGAYYPWLEAWQVNAIHATDIITRHVRGGEEIQNFHTIDHYSQAVFLSQHSDKNSVTTSEHLLATWSRLGLPQVQQLDNEGSFCGGHTHPRVFGRVVRLCLFCGIEPLFTPFYEPKRNYQIESFHSLWLQAFWSRQAFRDRQQVQQEVPLFERWYHHVYQPRALEGQTPAQVQCGAEGVCLTPELRRLIPNGRLPISNGCIHFMRKVDTTGHIELLNEAWLVGRQWIGEYVRATINTKESQLTFWHKSDDHSDWRLLKTRQFRIKETVQAVLPALRRNRTRCREYLPG
jgi:hypothetical protein